MSQSLRIMAAADECTSYGGVHEIQSADWDDAVHAGRGE